MSIGTIRSKTELDPQIAPSKPVWFTQKRSVACADASPGVAASVSLRFHQRVRAVAAASRRDGAATRAGPSGVLRSPSHAWTSFVLTFKYRAKTAWDACRVARTRFTARPFNALGGSGSVVVRRFRLPRACSSASWADPISSANTSFFMARFPCLRSRRLLREPFLHLYY